MTLDEWHWLYDFKMPTKVYGSGKTAMTEDEVRAIYREAYGDPDDE